MNVHVEVKKNHKAGRFIENRCTTTNARDVAMMGSRLATVHAAGTVGKEYRGEIQRGLIE
jgi:hypothetical protein